VATAGCRCGSAGTVSAQPPTWSPRSSRRGASRPSVWQDGAGVSASFRTTTCLGFMMAAKASSGANLGAPLHALERNRERTFRCCRAQCGPFLSGMHQRQRAVIMPTRTQVPGEGQGIPKGSAAFARRKMSLFMRRTLPPPSAPKSILSNLPVRRSVLIRPPGFAAPTAFHCGPHLRELTQSLRIGGAAAYHPG
jgi:hypothetical protein